VTVIDKDEILNLGTTDELDNHEVSWHIESRDRLRLKFETGDTPAPTTRIRYDPSSGSFSITFPAALAYAMHSVGGSLDWETKRGTLFATVTSRSDDHE
jgi:hypothetical protein